MAYVTLDDLAYGLGQAPACSPSMPTNSAGEEATTRWSTMQEAEKATLRAPHLSLLTTLDAALATAEADRRAVAALAEKISRERLALRLCSDIVREVVDLVLAGASPAHASSYTLSALSAIRDTAAARGVPAANVVLAMRQEIFRRMGQADPTPAGTFDDLFERLMTIARTQPAPVVPPQPQYWAQPYPQPYPQPQYVLPPPPVYVQPQPTAFAAPTPVEDEAPAPRHRRPRGEGRPRREKPLLENPVVVAAGVLGAVLLFTQFSNR